MQFIDYDKKIEYTTVTKEAIKIKTREESIAEEMRILYVALTRAKEKLIITGVENDLEKSLEQKKELLQIYENENGKINHLLLKKFLSYLGWLELSYFSHNDIEDLIELNKINKKDILDEDKAEEEIREDIICETSPDALERISKILNWKYDYEEMTNLQSKMSVTAIKELKQNEENKYKKSIGKPKFMIEQTKISAAEKGTIIHLILQKLNLKNDYSKKELEDFISQMCIKNQITENQKAAINSDKIYQILQSELIERIKSAKEIRKEVPFYTYIDTKEVYQTKESENILVQGIIDLFFIDKDDKLVLVDYKTDYTEAGVDLINKYKVQLEIYKKALEESIGMKVDEVYIYSIYMNKAIRVY